MSASPTLKPASVHLDAIRGELQSIAGRDPECGQRIGAALDGLQVELDRLQQQIELGRRIMREDLGRFNERSQELLELRQTRQVGQDAPAPEGEIQGRTIMMPAALHPDTAGLVLRFAVAMAWKLHAAEKKYGYTMDWMYPNWMDVCRDELRRHVGKGDPLDVANYAAFLWHHGQTTAKTDKPEAASAGASLTAVPRGWDIQEGDEEIMVTAPGGNPGGCYVSASDRSLSGRLLHALARDLLHAHPKSIHGTPAGSIAQQGMDAGKVATE